MWFFMRIICESDAKHLWLRQKQQTNKGSKRKKEERWSSRSIASKKGRFCLIQVHMIAVAIFFFCIIIHTHICVCYIQRFFITFYVFGADVYHMLPAVSHPSVCRQSGSMFQSCYINIVYYATTFPNTLRNCHTKSQYVWFMPSWDILIITLHKAITCMTSV